MSEESGKQAWWQQGYVRDLLALALLLLLCLLFFWRILTSNDADRGSFRQGDFYDQFYAFAAFEHSQLTAGELPLWNPYTFSGHPFLADVQAAVFYPLSLLTVLLSASGGMTAFALELEAIAHVFLAGIFTYFLARRLFRNRAGAILSAVVFAFGGYLSSYPPLQLAILETVAWLPLILLLLDLGVSELFRGPRRLGSLYLLLAGLILGIAILAGHPQTAMYVFYLAILYYVFKFWLTGRLTGETLTLGLAITGSVVFLLPALGLAAVQILPSWEFMRLSSRPGLGYSELSGGFAYLDFLQILLPRATGYWSPLYIGILPLLLALFALYLLFRGDAAGETARQSRRWRAEVAFWASVAGGALLLTVGDDNFFYSLFYNLVPGFGLFRGQERAAVLFSLAFSLLAGYGFTAILVRNRSAGDQEKDYQILLKMLAGLGVGVLALAALFFFGRSAPGAAPGGVMDAMLGLAVFVLLLLGSSLIWLLVWNRQPGNWWLATGLALCLVALDLFTVNAGPNVQSKKIENQYPATKTIQALQAQPGTFRVHNEFRLPGNYGAVFELEDTWGSSPLRLARYERLVENLPQERAWQLLNVGYVVTWLEDLDVPATIIHEEPAKKQEMTYVYQLQEDHPRAWVVYEAEVVADESEMLQRLAQPGFDPYNTALIEEPLRSNLAGRPAGQAQVTIAEKGPSSLDIFVEQPEDGLLVLSELHYPGWRASLDGSRVPILRADSVLLAIEVPAGQHRIQMSFEPTSVKLGMAISAATVLLSLAFILAVAINRVRKRHA